MIERDYRIKICIATERLLTLAQAVAYGIEEEGLFSDAVIWSNGQCLEQSTFDLACASPLEIAIGLENAKAFVLHRKAHLDEPILLVRNPDLNVESLRKLGQNAARLVVGKPLISSELFDNSV